MNGSKRGSQGGLSPRGTTNSPEKFRLQTAVADSKYNTEDEEIRADAETGKKGSPRNKTAVSPND